MLGRFIFLTALWLGVLSPAQANWDSASQIMETVTADMLALVNDERLRQPENIDELMGEIDKLVGESVDFEYIAKSIMGKYYRRASDREVADFSVVVKNTLLRTYAKAVVGFNFKEFEIIPPVEQSPDPDKQIVNVNVSAEDGAVYSLLYYMVYKDDRWLLVNVVVDGINLRITFRNQFAGLMEQHGKIAKVIEQWSEAMSDKVSGA
ncbi:MULTISPECIES: phospholipid-binding protein MlaC [unclassified Marinobacterium]|uniref:MlaC/ttg2D family ABC transporter substrate-binding protein n=1 Tax=unclassified Marinobacterium TaxID=2644139 RepID=UPI00156966E3|nr:MULTISPECIES: ABC transporter substrate-binding protein [unclassified Marinobacterium]NRP46267.1 putative phospholipid-binding protein MlaC precursor [Marinobacterium sp. xm-d-543]NRQ22603.1 putative phospholipid-binding protein MlaC precursor [Marinobacterium sp. xm-m-312]